MDTALGSNISRGRAPSCSFYGGQNSATIRAHQTAYSCARSPKSGYLPAKAVDFDYVVPCAPSAAYRHSRSLSRWAARTSYLAACRSLSPWASSGRAASEWTWCGSHSLAKFCYQNFPPVLPAGGSLRIGSCFSFQWWMSRLFAFCWWTWRLGKPCALAL